ncbi:hypothetical protein Ndes2526A_g03339 [Nannochloris sp. 'desiccata']
MPDMIEAGVEPSNERVTREQEDKDLIAASNDKMPANTEAKVAEETPLTEAPAPENGDGLAAVNDSEEIAVDNPTFSNQNGNTEDMNPEDEPSPITGNEGGLDGNADGDDATDNEVDLIAVAALAIPQAGAAPQHDFDISTLPTLSPLITRRDISRRDLPLICHVVGCNLGLGPQAEYYQRYRICKEHLRSTALLVDGAPQRFCQQCGKFHDLDAFDGDKRNCRARLAQHNSRRRKAGAGATSTSGIIPYGQGPNGRKRIPTSFEGFNTQFDFDFGSNGGGESRKKRARIPVSKEFPPPDKAQHISRPAKQRRDQDQEEDNGFLDQLLAAATGLEEEERSGAEQGQLQHDGQQQQQEQRQGGYYSPDAGHVDDEPYTYDPTATVHHLHAPIPVRQGPPRVLSRPVASAPPLRSQQYINGHAINLDNGRSSIAAGVARQHQQNGGGVGGFSQFSGWPGSLHGGAGGYLPQHAQQHAGHGHLPYGPGRPGSNPSAMAAAVSELERAMGRQLLQSLMAGAGLPAATSAAMAAAAAPPPPPQQPAAHQLLDVIRSLAGASGTVPPGAGAAAYYPPQGVQQQGHHQQLYNPQALYARALPPTSPAAALATSFGLEAPLQQDRNAGAQSALDALRKLVNTLPNTGAAPGAAGGVEPVFIKSEPVVAATADGIEAPSTKPPSPKNGSLIEQLAAALKAQNEATYAVIGHQAATTLLGSGGKPATTAPPGGGGGAGSGGGVKTEPAATTPAAPVPACGGGSLKTETSPPRSAPSLAQQDVMRRLMAMLESSKAEAVTQNSPTQSIPPAAIAPAAAAAAAAVAETHPARTGASPELLMSLLQAEAAAPEVVLQAKPAPLQET